MSSQKLYNDLYIAAAIDIGCKLCREAIWYNESCNWTTLDTVLIDDGRVDEKLTTCGPCFYDGTSGIGFFLANLYSATNEPIFRKTALGCLNHSIETCSKLLENRYSFFTGIIGLIWCCDHLSFLLHSENLRFHSDRLLDDLSTEKIFCPKIDVINGAASGIPALLTLSHSASTKKALDIAIKLGDFIVNSAEIIDNTMSWRTTKQQKRNLTGFAHGASGMINALLSLYEVTGINIYIESAKKALVYEKNSYDAQEKNWPDFRLSHNYSASHPKFSISWCHGAPGIALARLKAIEILGHEVYSQEAIDGFDTTSRFLIKQLSRPLSGFSLCHGLAGNADILLSGEESLNLNKYLKLINNVAMFGIHNYKEHSWPCGTHNGTEVPGMMLGLSGIGYFYLRMTRENRFKSVLSL